MALGLCPKLCSFPVLSRTRPGSFGEGGKFPLQHLTLAQGLNQNPGYPPQPTGPPLLPTATGKTGSPPQLHFIWESLGAASEQNFQGWPAAPLCRMGQGPAFPHPMYLDTPMPLIHSYPMCPSQCLAEQR